VPYDILVIATGSVYTWFGHDEWAKHSYALKTLRDADEMRDRLLRAFERAESCGDPDEIRRLLTFVVVGGGPTGVELAGAISELARYTLARDFRHIDPAAARVVLCEAGPVILAGFSQRLSRYARNKLGRLGVEVHTNTPADAVDADGIDVAGHRIQAANVLWAAGTEATPAAWWLGVPPAGRGLLPVGPDCIVSGHPGIFAIGDVALQEQDGRSLPALAPVAKQQGRYVARVVRARVLKRAVPGPFVYHDAGMLAILGRSAAVAQLPGLTLTGFVAWLLWSAVHLLLLVGFRNRIVVYVEWAWAWLTYGRGARLITDPDRVPLRDQ
jgi:NADH dehydrogenase